jgi:hypothetical protein
LQFYSQQSARTGRHRKRTLPEAFAAETETLPGKNAQARSVPCIGVPFSPGIRKRRLGFAWLPDTLFLD